MGYGAGNKEFFTSSAYADRATAPAERTVLVGDRIHPSMSPYGMRARESRDSSAHPQSVGVAFAVDVTGTMDEIPKLLARSKLAEFAVRAFAALPHMQLLFAAIGDQEAGDSAPFQVGQFESAMDRADEWLRRIYLEGKGGGGIEESYDLFLFFLARLAAIDCYEKRGRKGYAFLTLDECCRDRVSAQAANAVFGPGTLSRDVPIEQILAEAAEKFEIFVLIPDPRRAERCAAPWRRLVGDRVIVLDKPEDAAIVPAEIIRLTEGSGGLKEMMERLNDEGVLRAEANAVYRAIRPYAATIGKAGASRDVSDNRILPVRRASGIVRV